MIYIVKYTNPNNSIRTAPYVLETNSKADVNDLVKKAKEYPGSYNIVSIEKISEAKSKKVGAAK